MAGMLWLPYVPRQSAAWASEPALAGHARVDWRCHSTMVFSTIVRKLGFVWITLLLNDTIFGRFPINGEVACRLLFGNNVWTPYRTN